MQIITAPDDTPIQYDAVLFLAGGISGCPDWQEELIQLLADKLGDDYPLTVCNPRRPNYPMHDPAEAQKQIEWEFDFMQSSDIVSFWFPKETLCPITLYELGFHLGGHYVGYDGVIELVIGIHPEYQRIHDVHIQYGLATGDTLLAPSDLDTLAAQIANKVTNL